MLKLPLVELNRLFVVKLVGSKPLLDKPLLDKLLANRLSLEFNVEFSGEFSPELAVPERLVLL